MKEFRKFEFETESTEIDAVGAALLEARRGKIPGNAKLSFYSSYGAKPKFRIEAEWEVIESEAIITP